eukprot:2106587-Rhodomonas_salina.1
MQRLESDDEDFGDFEEYKEGELPDMEALQAMTQHSLQSAGIVSDADEWGGWGQDDAGAGAGAGAGVGGVGGSAVQAVEPAPKLVGLDEDPFADLIGSAVPDGGDEGGDGGGDEDEGPGLIFGSAGMPTG